MLLSRELARAASSGLPVPTGTKSSAPHSKAVMASSLRFVFPRTKMRGGLRGRSSPLRNFSASAEERTSRSGWNRLMHSRSSVSELVFATVQPIAVRARATRPFVSRRSSTFPVTLASYERGLIVSCAQADAYLKPRKQRPPSQCRLSSGCYVPKQGRFAHRR
jgi:hypothetical protein